MTNQKNIIQHNTYIVDHSTIGDNRIYLKHFVQILRAIGIDSLSYTYSNGVYTFNKNITLKENLLIDVMPLNFKAQKDNELTSFIRKQKNQSMIKLLSFFGDFNKNATLLSEEESKIFSIIKAVLTPKKYLFLQDPDENLSPESVKIVKEVLDFESTFHKRTIIIISKNAMTWFDQAHKIIQFNQDDILIKDKKDNKTKSNIVDLSRELIDQAA